MLLIPIVVFVAVFATIALVFVALTSRRAQIAKQTLARVDSIAAAGPRNVPDDVLDVRRKELFSNVTWINEFLNRIEVAPKLRLLLHQANMNWTVSRLMLLQVNAAAVTGYAVYLRTAALPLAVAVGAAAGAAPFVFVLSKRQRRFTQFERDLPQALDLMVSAMRAGHSLTAAIGMVAREIADPIGKEFRQCFDEQNFGLELRAAMLNLSMRVPVGDVRILVTAVLVQKETGGNLAEILERVAHVMRDRFRLRKQIQVHTAQGRLTGAILTLLPAILGVGLYIVNPEHMSLLWKRPLGVKLLYGAALGISLGALTIRKIIRVRI
ncbi:MAG: type II secretion system F family protein [Bryobacteraceae bacterium]